MDLTLDEEQDAFRQAVRSWVDTEYPPSRARELEAREDQYPRELWDDMTAAGFHGIGIPVESGGQGGDTITQVILAKELARNLASLSSAWSVTSFAGAKAILANGTTEQRDRFLPAICEGRCRFAIAITEPAGGTDLLGGLRTKATRTEGGWILSGQKTWSTGAKDADYLLVLARTDPDEEKPARAMTLFIVPQDHEGVTARPIPKLGMRAIASCDVFLDDVGVSDAAVLGEVGGGWKHILATLNHERIMVAAVGVGVLEGVLETAVRYAMEREAFGRQIGAFQAIQHYLADIATWRMETELLTMHAASLEMRGLPCGTEATMAKLASAEKASAAADLGIQILGGLGYSMDTDMQRYWRDSRLWRIAPISSEMARNVIAESLGLPRSF